MKKLLCAALIAAALMSVSCNKDKGDGGKDPDYNGTTMESALAIHRGDFYGAGTSNYIIRLMNTSENASGNTVIDQIAVIEINAQAATKTSNAIADGTYTVNAASKAGGTMVPCDATGSVMKGSYYFLFDSDGSTLNEIDVTEGNVVISHNGDEYTVTAELFGGGKAFYGRYIGKLAVGGLQSDFVTLSVPEYIAATYYGDYYNLGNTNWYLDFYDQDNLDTYDQPIPEGIDIYFDILCPTNTLANGIPAGTYPLDYLGFGNNGTIVYAAYYNNGDEDPFIDGSVQISRSSSSYTVNATLFGLSNAYKLSYTGAIDTYDGTEESSAPSGIARPAKKAIRAAK